MKETNLNNLLVEKIGQCLHDTQCAEGSEYIHAGGHKGGTIAMEKQVDAKTGGHHTDACTKPILTDSIQGFPTSRSGRGGIVQLEGVL